MQIGYYIEFITGKRKLRLLRKNPVGVELEEDAGLLLSHNLLIYPYPDSSTVYTLLSERRNVEGFVLNLVGSIELRCNIGYT